MHPQNWKSQPYESAHTHTHTMCTKDAFSSSGWCIQSPRGSWLRQLQLFSLSPSRPAWGSARCPPAFLSLPDPPRSLKMGQTEEVKCRGNKSRVKWNLLKTKNPQNRNIYKRNSLPLCQNWLTNEPPNKDFPRGHRHSHASWPHFAWTSRRSWKTRHIFVQTDPSLKTADFLGTVFHRRRIYSIRTRSVSLVSCMGGQKIWW